MEPSRLKRNSLLPPSKTASAKRHARIDVRDRGFSEFTWTLGSSLMLGYVVPTVIACRPHPPVWLPPSHFPAMPVIGPVFGFCLATRPSGLSLLYSPGLPPSVSAGRFEMCLPQYFHPDTGHHEKMGTTWPLRHSHKSASRGVPNFGV